MEVKKLAPYFLGAALGAGSAYGFLVHQRSESAEDVKVMLLAKGANENQALCAKRIFNSIPVMKFIFSGEKEQQKMVDEIFVTCNIN